MKFLQGVSALTFIAGLLSGMATQWILALDLPVYAKVLCASLVLLSALLLFISDFEKAMLRK